MKRQTSSGRKARAAEDWKPLLTTCTGSSRRSTPAAGATLLFLGACPHDFRLTRSTRSGLTLNRVDNRPDLVRSTVGHFQRNIENYRQAQVSDPTMPLQQAGDETGRDTHQCD